MTLSDVNFLWKEERVRLLVVSPGASTTPIYSPRSSSTPIYFPGSSTPSRYSPGASTSQSYFLGTSRNAECSNCKHLLDKITVLEATVDMYMHPEQHTVNSSALFHEVYNNMGKLDLEYFFFFSSIAVQTSGSGIPNLWQWQQPSLAVGTYTASRNSILAVEMPCAFYSQHDMGSNKLTDDYLDGFIPPGFISPFAMYDMRNKLIISFFFFSSIAVQTFGSGIPNLLAVATTFTGSGNLYCQWELYPGSGNALCILFPTCFFIIAVQTLGSGIFILLAVGTPSTGSGNIYCQWELSPSSGNALCILFPTISNTFTRRVNNSLQKVKENQDKDKIGSKRDKNGKRSEARKCQSQTQSIKQEKLKKIQVKRPKVQNPKKCSSCETLYTRDCVCSKGNVEDNILVPKPPKNYARCSHPVDGPYCQGCALLRQKLEENLVTHSQEFQNTFESSNDSTNVFNAPREPFVVKQDHGSFVDKIIFDLTRAPDSPHLHTVSPNQFRCFHCKDVLGDGVACQRWDGVACQRCTCTKCGSGLSKGLCYICGNNQNSLNDSLSLSENSSQSPPHINQCCYECGDPLDGIFYKRCTCKSCGKDAHIDYNCPPKVPVISNPEPCKNQTIDELPQTLPSFHPTFHSEDESSFTCDSTPNYVDESPNIFNPPPQPFVNFAGTMLIMVTIVHLKLRLSIRSRVTIKTLISRKIFKLFHKNILVVMIAGLLMKLTNLNSTLAKLTEQMTSFTSFCEMACQFIQKKQEEKQLEEERAAKAKNWKLPVCYDDDDEEEISDSLEDNIISGLPSCSEITLNEHVLSTEEPDNSLSMGDEHLDTILATESDEFIKSSVENLIPIPSEFEGIHEHMRDVPFHDKSPPLDVSKDQFEDLSDSNNEFSSIDDDSFSINNIDYVEASPLDSELVSLKVMEIVIPKVGGIDDDILLTIKYDILCEKLLNVNLLIAKIEALNDNPTSSSDCKTKSSSTSLNSLLDKTKTSDNSLPEFENLCFDVEEISSCSTTTHSDISLSEYEVFYDDHVKEISSGSPTTNSDYSLYVSFIFDFRSTPFLLPIGVEPNSRDFTKDVVEDISPTKEPQVHNALPTHPTLQLNLKFQPFSEPLFTYVVWIFLPFLVYSIAPHYLLSLRNEDTILIPAFTILVFLGRMYLIGVELS
nr:hypothetical protein [Tanacetum cinerariifolium]